VSKTYRRWLPDVPAPPRGLEEEVTAYMSGRAGAAAEECDIDALGRPVLPPEHTIVSHPPHYIGGRRHEPIDVILDWGLGFCLGNVVKYIARAGRKGPALGDLKKARWYLDRWIAELVRSDG